MTGTMTLVAAVVTVSDRAHLGVREDVSGPALVEAVQAVGGEVAHTAVVPDEIEDIQAELRRIADLGEIPLILTTGGTGLGPRDVTPEATRGVIEREVPGLAEHMRAATLHHTIFAVLSRGIAGIRRRTLIVNLPGSPKGASQTFEAIAPLLPHALQILAGSEDHPEP
jgi:molybdenum cofactor synthesis domain-containing protein